MSGLYPKSLSAQSAAEPFMPFIAKATSVSSGSEMRNRCGFPNSPCIDFRIAVTADSKSLKRNEAWTVLPGLKERIFIVSSVTTPKAPSEPIMIWSMSGPMAAAG
ncbi:MAG: hypothetical protein BWY96_01479 [Spirochaetes bacterium ADurb.BinA120]|nr:MAG: hypothetical protein BWY96_01479 [Spirochaetes bacterium ADurb.BinA120]